MWFSDFIPATRRQNRDQGCRQRPREGGETGSKPSLCLACHTPDPSFLPALGATEYLTSHLGSQHWGGLCMHTEASRQREGRGLRQPQASTLNSIGNGEVAPEPDCCAPSKDLRGRTLWGRRAETPTEHCLHLSLFSQQFFRVGSTVPLTAEELRAPAAVRAFLPKLQGMVRSRFANECF